MKARYLVAPLALALLLVAAPTSLAQVEVVQSEIKDAIIEQFPGPPGPGERSLAGVLFSYCYGQGGLAPPNENTVKLTVTPKTWPEWATVRNAFGRNSFEVTIDNTKAIAPDEQRCIAVSELMIEASIAEDAKGGESGTVEVEITGTAVGIIAGPEPVTVTQELVVKEPPGGILEDLKNVTGGPDDIDLEEPSTGNSPGVGGLFTLAVVAAAALAFGRRRR